MITVNEIKNAKTQSELSDLVETAASERDYVLNNSASYADDAKRFENISHDFASILQTAEKKWFELDN